MKDDPELQINESRSDDSSYSPKGRRIGSGISKFLRILLGVLLVLIFVFGILYFLSKPRTGGEANILQSRMTAQEQTVARLEKQLLELQGKVNILGPDPALLQRLDAIAQEVEALEKEIQSIAESKARPPAPSKPAVSTVKSLGQAFVEVAKKVQPAVVNITTEKTVTMRPWDRFGEEFFRGSPFEDFFRGFGSPREKGREYQHKQRSGGSGVIVDKEGYILTNNHVVEGVDKVKVRLNDGREFTATLKGQDTRTDLAVLNIKAKDLPVANLGDSDKLEVGEWAIAIGSPFGLEHTVTIGAISAKGRSGLGTGTYEDFIQTDASINPGNSGGPLINIDGEVIGINAMIIQPGTGIGFAIPINMAKQILNDLIKHGKVVRPWLGISAQDLTAEMMEYFKVKEKEGVLVAQVYPGTGAEKAGLSSGDIIRSVDDKPVKNVNELVKEIQKKKVGQTVKLAIIRDGKPTTIEVTTTAMPEKAELAKEKEEEEKMGARVQELTPQLSARYRISGIKHGVVVVSVEDGSLANEIGLQEGDVILEINRKKIENTKDFERAMKDLDVDKGIVFLLHRRGSTFWHSYKK